MMHEMHFATGLQMMTTRNMDVNGSLAQTAVHSPDYQVNDVSITGGVELGEISDVDEPVMGSLGPPPANHLISGEYHLVSTKRLCPGLIHQPGGITNRRECFSSATSNRRSRFRDQQMILEIAGVVEAVLVLYHPIILGQSVVYHRIDSHMTTIAPSRAAIATLGVNGIYTFYSK